jgi:hypothetical protein
MAARFGPLSGSAFGRLPCWLASAEMTVVMSLVFAWGRQITRGFFAEPLTDNGSGFVGIAFGELPRGDGLMDLS